MLSVTFVGGMVKTFAQEDLARRVAKANALAAPDENYLDAIISVAMESAIADTMPPKLSASYPDIPVAENSPVQLPRRRRGRLDSSARNLDSKPTFKGLSGGQMSNKECVHLRLKSVYG